MVLAPQLRQSLKILQVPVQELRSTIREELEINPALDELPSEGMNIEVSPGLSDETPMTSEEKEGGNTEELKLGEDYDIYNKLDEDWKDYFAQESGNRVYTSEDAKRRQHFFDSLVSETSLQEHLVDQADMADLSADEKKAIQYLIGSLDKRGFLNGTISDIALLTSLPLKAVQNAHDALLTFDPRGVGCFDLQHCLLFQLELNGKKDSLPYKILKNHITNSC